MKSTYKKYKIVIYLIGSLLLCPVVTLAATFTFDPPSQSYGVGDEILLPLLLNTDGQSINVISGSIDVGQGVSIVGILENNSPITYWITPPTIEANTVSFSGMIPGGLSNIINPLTGVTSPVQILTLELKVTEPGNLQVTPTDFHAYLNDGLGSETTALVSPLELNLLAQSVHTDSTSSDQTPPESFVPVIVSNQNLYNGKYVLVFITADKESGIDHYEVKEGSGPWKDAQSPYLIADQSLQSTLQVKAVDHAGNYTIGSPTNIPNKTGVSMMQILLMIIVGIILFLIILYFLKKRRSHKMI